MQYRALNPKPLLSTGTTGAVSELVASVDLLRKGYEVFRALSPSCSCDLAILKDHQLLRIEVRTGKRSATGKITYPPDRANADHFAVVVGTEVHYFPVLPDPHT